MSMFSSHAINLHPSPIHVKKDILWMIDRLKSVSKINKLLASYHLFQEYKRLSDVSFDQLDPEDAIFFTLIRRPLHSVKIKTDKLISYIPNFSNKLPPYLFDSLRIITLIICHSETTDSNKKNEIKCKLNELLKHRRSGYLNLSGLDLRGLNFEKANLTGIDFAGCQVDGLNVILANLKETNWNNVKDTPEFLSPEAFQNEVTLNSALDQLNLDSQDLTEMLAEWLANKLEKMEVCENTIKMFESAFEHSFHYQGKPRKDVSLSAYIHLLTYKVFPKMDDNKKIESLTDSQETILLKAHKVSEEAAKQIATKTFRR